MSDQQIVARIKKSSKYHGQTKPGEWFDVRFITDRTCGYSIKGNNNQYRLIDVAIGVRLDDGSIITIKGPRQ